MLLTTVFYKLSRRAPAIVKELIRKGVERQAAARATTSTPTSSRATTRGTSACAWCPTATSSRRSARADASIVTDRIETFTETGLKLESGAELEADVIVTATGLNVLMLGGMKIDRRRPRGRAARDRRATRA